MTFDEERRPRVQARMQTLIDGFGLDVAFQPIVDLASGRVVGAEALARFHDPEGNAIPTERCFLDAHAVDMGVPLELAVIRRALDCEQARLPEGRYLALNVSLLLCSSTTTSRSRSPRTTRTARSWSRSPSTSRSRTTSCCPHPWTACASSACAWRSTTSARASPPSATSRA